MKSPLIPVKALSFFIWLAEFGQPDRSEGGIIFPDGAEMSSRYLDSEYRMGLVLATGPGQVVNGKLIPMLEPAPGDIVVYSRKVGQKIMMQYDHPQYGKLWVRIIDQNQCDLVYEDFVPWWNPAECQKSPLDWFNS